MQSLLRRHLASLLSLTLAILLCVGVVTTARAETPAAKAYPVQAITAETSCAVCGMYPAQYPQWQSQVIFKDKGMVAFDGGRCMFLFLLHMPQFDSRHTAAEVAMVWVKDFGTGAWTDGATASYVVDSTVLGPMGSKELIPFATEEAARKFQQQNGGTVEPYAKITREMIQPLMGMGGMMHGPQGHQPMPMP